MKVYCAFIPSYMLERMAKSDNEDAAKLAQSAIAQSNVFRGSRMTGLVPEAGAPGAVAAARVSMPEPGRAKRIVYDSKGQEVTGQNASRGEGDPDQDDATINTVYNYAGLVRDHFRNTWSRDSIDNHGMNLILNVHYGKNFPNAFWDGTQMVFGDGDGKIFGDFSRSLDVVAHELAHGITQFTSNLIYDGEPGALNEHFSDVFGATLTQNVEGTTKNPEKADWLIGDEIMGPTLYGEALRCMKAPGTAYDNSLLGRDSQPDHMDQFYTGREDNHGVHINSGIMNRVFYLSAVGMGDTNQAAAIWYDALHKLWPNATFNDAVKVIASTARLHTRERRGRVHPAAPQLIRAAFKEVGLPKKIA